MGAPAKCTKDINHLSRSLGRRHCHCSPESYPQAGTRGPPPGTEERGVSVPFLKPARVSAGPPLLPPRSPPVTAAGQASSFPETPPQSSRRDLWPATYLRVRFLPLPAPVPLPASTENTLPVTYALRLGLSRPSERSLRGQGAFCRTTAEPANLDRCRAHGNL